MRAHRFLHVGPLAVPFALPLVPAVLLACSSADFEVSNGSGEDSGAVIDSSAGGDSSMTDSGVGGDSVVEGGRDSITPIDTGGTGDGISTDGVSSCGALSSDATDVYVDNVSALSSVGTKACPFHSIHEATVLPWSAAGGHRFIHVAAGVYAESHSNVVADGVTLDGAGVGTTQVTGGGSCSGGANCVFEIAGGGTLSNVTVVGSGASHAIVMDAVTSGAIAPLVHHVAANGAGSGLAGIFARGSADVGPNVALTGNGRGLDSAGDGQIHVIASGTPKPSDNAFGNSVQSGIYMEGTATLLFDAGEVHNNGTYGIYLNGAAGVHTIRTAHVHDNSYDGIALTANSSLFVRGSVFEANGFGIRFVKTATNTIDLGAGATSSSSGGNVFGGVTALLRNHAGGVCLNLSVSPTYSVPAVGNQWASCDPSVGYGTGCDSSSTYNDIFLASTGAGPVLPNWSGCTLGP